MRVREPRLDPIPTFDILSTVSDPRSINEARLDLNANLPGGLGCPCCEQYAKTYRRKVASGMASLLIEIYKVFRFRGFPKGFDDPAHWLHMPGFIRRNRIIANGSNDAAMMVHWRLVERADDILRATGAVSKAFADHRGRYRITDLGIAFVEGRVSIPRFLYIYNNKVVGEDEERATITDALADKLNFSELMGRPVLENVA
jgi:hypothetical protein